LYISRLARLVLGAGRKMGIREIVHHKTSKNIFEAETAALERLTNLAREGNFGVEVGSGVRFG
jgi:hypothetical protein